MWSKELQQQTREYFKDIPFAAMKKIGGTYGICVYRDKCYIITDRKTNAEYIYHSMDALIDAQWAID